MARLKWLGGRLDTLVTDENETDEYLTFSILDLRNQEIK